MTSETILSNTPPPDGDIALFAIAHPEVMEALRDFRDSAMERDCILHPVATAEDIAAFEQFFGITLPVEYSLFLRVVGNGVEDDDGIIPVVGIPVGQALEEAKWQEVKALIQKPSPLQDNQCEYHSLQGIYYWEMENAEQDEEEVENREPVMHNFEPFEQGTWTLTDYFEGAYLVVCGDGKGKVWQENSRYEFFDDKPGEPGLCCVAPAGDFLQWLKEF